MSSIRVGGSAAASLEGLSLDGGWQVTHRNPRPLGATGGNFSESYEVRNGQTVAFLKALDYSQALGQPNQVELLQYMTAAYTHERRLLELCAEKKLNRIVRGLGSGQVTVPDAGPLNSVDYLIFEIADGDVRKRRDQMLSLDYAFTFRAIHSAAVAVQQLHGEGVYHQDIKPSNLLVFPGDSVKVADLGRSLHDGFVAPHEYAKVAGDPTYAPPELLYGWAPLSLTASRRSCDVFHLGSLLFYFFTKVNLTHALFGELDPRFHPRQWSGTYADVLPFLREAFDRAINSFEQEVPEKYKKQTLRLLAQLTDPDPLLRGDPHRQPTTAARFAVERFVSAFDRLAYDSEIDVGLRSGR